MKSFIKNQITEITGLAPRLVQFYTDEGLIKPEVDKGAGRGRARKYSIKNLFQFALIKELKDYGINIAALKSIMGFIQKYLSAARFESMIEYPKLTLIILKDKDNKLTVNFGVNYDDSQDQGFKIPTEVLEISDGEVKGKSPFEFVISDCISFICLDILGLYNKTIGKTG